MNENNVTQEELNFEKVSSSKGKYQVKFPFLDIPVEMNEAYYKSLLKSKNKGINLN